MRPGRPGRRARGPPPRSAPDRVLRSRSGAPRPARPCPARPRGLPYQRRYGKVNGRRRPALFPARGLGLRPARSWKPAPASACASAARDVTSSSQVSVTSPMQVRVRGLEPRLLLERRGEAHHAALAADAGDLERCRSRSPSGRSYRRPPPERAPPTPASVTSSGSWVAQITVVPCSRARSASRPPIAIVVDAVEPRRRLVGDEHPGPGGDRAGERDALALAGREPVDGARRRGRRGRRSRARPSPARAPRRRRCPGGRATSSTFSRAVSTPERPGVCPTTPMRSRRNAARASRSSRERTTPPITTSPSSGRVEPGEQREERRLARAGRARHGA